jgi:RNA polymerase-binding transcription factor DksA
VTPPGVGSGDATTAVTTATATTRTVLEAERVTTRRRIGALTAEFDEIVAGAADSNGDDEHDPEGSTIAFELAQIAGLLLEARSYLNELDRAAERLDAGTYGLCEQCGSAIAPARLAARPAARTCISCAANPIPPA